MKVITTMALTSLAILTARGQASDTVVVSLGNTSQLVFTIGDRSDIETLKYYDFQELFDDILRRIEDGDSSRLEPQVRRDDIREAESPLVLPLADENKKLSNDDSENDEDQGSDRESRHHRRGIGRTWQTSNLDFGMNNYLSGTGEFPDRRDNHSVRPWGSWYVAINSLQRTKAGKNFFIEWGAGVSWYNFKFQSDQIAVSATPEEVNFSPVVANPEYDYVKSKLRVTYLNVSLIPVLDFGDRGRKTRIWDSYGSEFRIGIGPYAGYKIGSKSKIVYRDDDDVVKRQKNRDTFYLNDFRYGARLQVGFRSTDLFFNYDLNELFMEGRGPKLNAMSFGVIF